MVKFGLNRPPKPIADVSIRKGLASLADRAHRAGDYDAPMDRLMLLIHGFNVSEDDAISSLGAFRDSVADLSRDLARQSMIFTWPGDSPVLGPAAFSLLIAVARDGAPILLKEINRRFTGKNAPRQLVIVAHSLGCRLTLQALAAMAARGGPAAPRSGRPEGLEKLIVILMAAAVPVQMQPLMEAALSVADAIVLLHSPADSVLRLAFPPGQALAREGAGWMPEAVGLRGLPRELGWMATLHMRDHDHGDYWIGHEAPSVICRLLSYLLPGLAVRQSRPSPSRMPEHRLPMTDLLAEHVNRW
jgi:hypothetical protein